MQNLVDVSDIFKFFSARGRGRGSPRRQEGWGIGSFAKIPGGGGGFPGGGAGAGRVSAANWGILGAGAKYFFRGRNVHQEKSRIQKSFLAGYPTICGAAGKVWETNVCVPIFHAKGFWVAISAATYKNAKCPTLKTCRVGHGKTAEKQPEKQPKHPKTAEKQSKQLFFGCFGCFSGCFLAALP